MEGNSVPLFALPVVDAGDTDVFAALPGLVSPLGMFWSRSPTGLEPPEGTELDRSVRSVVLRETLTGVLGGSGPAASLVL